MSFNSQYTFLAQHVVTIRCNHRLHKGINFRQIQPIGFKNGSLNHILRECHLIDDNRAKMHGAIGKSADSPVHGQTIVHLKRTDIKPVLRRSGTVMNFQYWRFIINAVNARQHLLFARFVTGIAFGQ